MYRLSLCVMLFLTTGSAFAQMQVPPRSIQQVTDPAMVVIDRGVKLEVLATKRATPRSDGAGRVISHHVVTASAASPIGPRQLGVVFNFAMQQQGFISGEIAFALKKGSTVAELSQALYPGLKRITESAVYVVNARTPLEFIQVLKRLQARADVDWVEPIVNYTAVDGVPSAK